ncbi:MAG: hypothetical protein AB1Y25_03425 [Cycloclasticus sp.]
MKYFFILSVLFSSSVLSEPLSGQKNVYLQSGAGELLLIAEISFQPVDDKIHYQLTIVDEVFSNQFLLMRPFQCLMGAAQVMCHVPYPYLKKGFVLKSDLRDLSYDLLFLHKKPSEYGINLWNGMFYKFELLDDTVVGSVFEVDMNIIASPPDNAEEPFPADEIFSADMANYVYPKILIK